MVRHWQILVGVRWIISNASNNYGIKRVDFVDWLANSDYVENTNQYFASGQAKHTDTKDYYAGQTYHFYWDYNYGYDSWYSVGEYGAEI